MSHKQQSAIMSPQASKEAEKDRKHSEMRFAADLGDVLGTEVGRRVLRGILAGTGVRPVPPELVFDGENDIAPMSTVSNAGLHRYGCRMSREWFAAEPTLTAQMWSEWVDELAREISDNRLKPDDGGDDDDDSVSVS